MSGSAGRSASNPYQPPISAGSGLSPLVRMQLSVMMFLQYFVWGVWAVTLGTYLISAHNFEESQVGAVYSTGPIATIIAPLFVGMIADRFFSAQKVLGVLHLAGAGLMYYTSTLSTFQGVWWFVLLYFLCYMPTIALTNSLSFHHLTDPDRQFPGIRVLGTIGWIAAGWLVGLAHLEKVNVPMQFAAGSSLVLGVFCFFLPHTPPKATGPVSVGKLLGLDAIGLMRRWPFAVFMIGSFLICIPLQFYYTLCNVFLNEIHKPWEVTLNLLGNPIPIDVTAPAFVQTFGQAAEILFMLLMPLFFVRLGVKWMLLVGMAAWALRYTLFAFGNAGPEYWMIVLGVLLHGVCFDFFFLTGFIYVDRNAPVELRASAQGFLSLVTWGLAGWLGATAAGFVFQKTALESGGHDWRTFWLWPAAAAGAVTVVFALTFYDPKYDRSAPVEK